MIAARCPVSLRRAQKTSPLPEIFLPQSSAAASDSAEPMAELKRASPSKGMFAPHLDLFQVADIYAQNGACADQCAH